MDRRKRKSQMAIKAALIQLLNKKEFNAVKVSEICELADINRGTFYLNYLDKYDLLEKIIHEQIDLLVLYCKERQHGEYSSLNLTFCYIAENKTVFRLIFTADSQGIFNQYLAQHILSELSADSTSEIKAIFTASGITGILGWYLLNESATVESLYEIEDIVAKLQ
ncbi:TetR/AcrR family transcriptional regulator [Enterococcus sp. BWM-S5]|uniref:TetR/AcrR family transcriptional regulator n=1 Tax=Enterococcus larvae TaxID=2794352 RepID=A0ABS4CMC3_9ENTE|nr:TetR family transcriptional regulator [Enterococcus larvae]MBP1047427.1 TetR/AcrR family transcriptional regulator [Enterococcus larvae]